MQSVDLTTLSAAVAEIQAQWVPARLEQVYQRDRHTLQLALRTLQGRSWLTLCWHPQTARLHIDHPPPRLPDTFTFSQQLQHQLGGLALILVCLTDPWERVVDLQFARRPGEPALWHLYGEVMGKYSNAILVNQQNVIVTAAHQVSSQQSSVRPIQTGQTYESPPALTEAIPCLQETYDRWYERLTLIPGSLKHNLLKNYRGVSSQLLTGLFATAGLAIDCTTEQLHPRQWRQLFESWQFWQQCLKQRQFQPGYTASGYNVLGWGVIEPVANVQVLLRDYYTQQVNQQEFSQLRHRLQQKLDYLLGKLRQKASGFEQRLSQSDQADRLKNQADLLMAHLHLWQPGSQSLCLPDFHTAEPITVPLNPEKNAVQNAQMLYKQHQKLKRARQAIEPLLAEVASEVTYLEQVETALAQLSDYLCTDDLMTLKEIQEELNQQGYGDRTTRSSATALPPTAGFHRHRSPSNFEILVGRNNRQNDQLTFRLATAYDLWFHAQEIPGSHLLLRPPAGAEITPADLQMAADLTAYYSRARQGEQVPVVYTSPQNVYKPKGAKPGMVVYKHEQVLWGNAQRGQIYIQGLASQANAPSN